jgi:hypothetical protein
MPMDPLKFLSDTVFKAPFSLVGKLFQSKMGMFVYGIMSQWYIVIMLGSAVVAFWVFKGLEEVGILSEAYEIVSVAMEDSKAIARYCTPKIRDLNALWECVQNPPKYQRTKYEQDMYDSVEKESKAFQKNMGNAQGSESQEHGGGQESDDPYAEMIKPR